MARRRADQEGLDLTGRLGESSKVCASVAAFSGDGRRLAYATEYAVHVWEWGTRRQEVATFKAHNRVVYGVALSPDGSELATCGYDDEEDPKGENISGDRVHVWRLGGKEPVCTAAFAVKGAQRLDFALGGAALLVSEDGGGCVLLDKKTGKRLWQWKPPAGYTRFAVAPDRRHVALANSNGTIYIVRLKGPDKP